VSLSEHEGFCVPLLEAMAFGLPVVAYDAGAVAETLDGAGVLLAHKRPEEVAGLLHTLAREGSVRQAVLAGQQRRLEAARRMDTGARLLEHLRPLVEP
jgi:glycosyltransferase involved in cell wall biosynthesis